MSYKAHRGSRSARRRVAYAALGLLSEGGTCVAVTVNQVRDHKIDHGFLKPTPRPTAPKTARNRLDVQLIAWLEDWDPVWSKQHLADYLDDVAARGPQRNRDPVTEEAYGVAVIERWVALDDDISERIYRLIDEGELYHDVEAAPRGGARFRGQSPSGCRSRPRGGGRRAPRSVGDAWLRFGEGWRPTEWASDD